MAISGWLNVFLMLLFIFFFFFKQKTAYEMRISDWSSDVCSSDLGLLPGRVRLLFQPAEEVMPGGALELVAQGALNGVSHIFCLHCDPTLDVGEIGVREGALTGAADSLDVHLIGKGDRKSTRLNSSH